MHLRPLDRYPVARRCAPPDISVAYMDEHSYDFPYMNISPLQLYKCLAGGRFHGIV